VILAHRTPNKETRPMRLQIPRRTFLRSSGVAIGLPFLEAMTAVNASAAAAGPKRMVFIGVPFGFDPPMLVPTSTGAGYQLPPHLETLAECRDDFTVISGLSHPNTGGGGHKAEAVMLTGAPYPDYSHNLKNTISVDQAFAAHVEGRTRYGSLVLSTYNGTLSYTANGVAIPAVNRPSEVFKRLFLAATPSQAEEEMWRIDQGRSMLDSVSEQAGRLRSRISAADRSRVDEYFASVRDVERQLQMAREWVGRPKPPASGPPPIDISDDALQQKRLELMVDMIYLALVTDSTRTVTIKTFGMHHDLSHHGKEPKKRADCQAVEQQLIASFGTLVRKLKTAEEGGGSLLDGTMVLMTSNLRDGNSHWTHDLPVLLAGGGFRHGRHLAFNESYVSELAAADQPGAAAEKKTAPRMGINQAPLCNLFTSMLRQAGVDIERFGSATGSLAGLEARG
jgi:hypothetical protein